MPDLMKCAIPVDSASYVAEAGDDFISTKLDGGASRQRLAQLGSVATVNVQWSVGRDSYDYLQAFYRQNKGKTFSIDLILDYAEPREYTARFVPKTWKLASQSGLTYVQQVQLEVVPLPVNNDEDQMILSRYTV
jgi:hypothetical protein